MRSPFPRKNLFLNETAAFVGRENRSSPRRQSPRKTSAEGTVQLGITGTRDRGKAAAQKRKRGFRAVHFNATFQEKKGHRQEMSTREGRRREVCRLEQVSGVLTEKRLD